MVKPQYLEHAVFVSTLPNDVVADHLNAVFQDCGNIRNIFVVYENGSEALVSFDTNEAAEKAIALSGTEVLKCKITVSKYDPKQQDFPALVFKRKPSAMAKHLASILLTAKAFDDKHHITETINNTTKMIVQRVDTFAEDHKIKEKLQAVGEKTTELARDLDERWKITESVQRLDERYKISEKAKAVSETVSNNPHVQRGVSVIQNAANTVVSQIHNLREDTVSLMAEHEAQQQHNTPASFELQQPVNGGDSQPQPQQPQQPQQPPK